MSKAMRMRIVYAQWSSICQPALQYKHNIVSHTRGIADVCSRCDKKNGVYISPSKLDSMRLQDSSMTDARLCPRHTDADGQRVILSAAERRHDSVTLSLPPSLPPSHTTVPSCHKHCIPHRHHQLQQQHQRACWPLARITTGQVRNNHVDMDGCSTIHVSNNKKAWLTPGKRATAVYVWRLVFAISTLFDAP